MFYLNKNIKLVTFLFSSFILVFFGGCVGNNLGNTNSGANMQKNIGVVTPQAFKDKKQVAIGGFKISFITERKMTSQNRGSFLDGGAGMARASANTVLNGISNVSMQTITNQAYKNFVSMLQQNGYEVIETSKLLNNKTFNEVVTKTSPLNTDEPLPAIKAKALIFAPSGEKLRLFSNQGDGVQAFGWTSPEAGFSKAAEELKIPILDVHYVINFSSSENYSGRDTASISVGQSIQVLRSSRLLITSGQGGTFSTNIGSIVLQNEEVSSEKFANIVKEEQSTLNKVGNVIAAGMTVLLGGGERELETYIYNADSKKYEEVSLNVINKTSKNFISEMTSLR